MSQPNDDVDTRYLHSRRRLGQTTELDLVCGNIAKRAALKILKMVVRIDVGIKPAARAVNGEFAHQATLREQIQRVVQRRLGHAGVGSAQRC